MNPSNSLDFKSIERHEVGAYSQVAAEYYDSVAHPTCADFRMACRIYLDRLFRHERPNGIIADIGCGQSLVAEFMLQVDYGHDGHLVLVDNSKEMLRANRRSERIETRLLDIEAEPFGNSEFDWVFAVLGDPYNTCAAWQNIAGALRDGGRCVFIVPSHVWVESFRSSDEHERHDVARFVTKSGENIYLPSIIRSKAEQNHLIAKKGLKLTAIESIKLAEMPFVLSPKIHRFLRSFDPIIDVYRCAK